MLRTLALHFLVVVVAGALHAQPLTYADDFLFKLYSLRASYVLLS